jgi:hypothetical protein
MAAWVETISARQDRRVGQAGEIEILLDRLDWLHGQDRRLVELYLRHGASFVQLEQISGLNRRSLARRVQRLCRRMMGWEYVTLKRHECLFTDRERAVTYDHFLLGLGYRTIASQRRLSQAAVRRIIGQMKDWLKERNGNSKTKRYIGNNIKD